MLGLKYQICFDIYHLLVMSLLFYKLSHKNWHKPPTEPLCFLRIVREISLNN